MNKSMNISIGQSEQQDTAGPNLTEMNPARTRSGSSSTYLMVPMLIFFALLIFAVIRGPNLISAAGIGSAVIVVAPLILAVYALTIIVMAGRAGVDLSIGPLIGFINVGMIQLFAAGYIESPIAFFLYAMAVGIAYQVLQAVFILFLRVQPIIVSLSGYLTLVGLNLMIMPRPGGVAPDWMFSWGSGTTLISPVLIILLIATAAWYLLTRTAFFGHLRLMGADERAAYTSGVPIYWVRLGAHAIGGVYAGLAAITFTSLISSGDPTQGTTYTLMAVTALVLGGANLAGGRGSAFGSLLGALNIYLITYVLSTFNFGKVQSFVTDLAYGVMLVISLLISVALPHLQKRTRGLSPLMFFVILAVIALGVIMHTTMDQSMPPLVGVSASAMALESSTGAETATAATANGYSAGTYILFIIIGVAAVVTVFRLLFKHTNMSMIVLTIVLGIVALGLIFNPDKPANGTAQEQTSTSARHLSDLADAPLFFSLETTSAESKNSVPLPKATVALLSFVALVLLTSLIILVMLPTVTQRTKRIAFYLAAASTAIVAIGALFFDSFEQGYLASTLSREIYAVILVGVALFTMSAPLVHTRFKNISYVFITLLGLLALVSVYFLSSAREPNAPKPQVTYAAPVFNVESTGLGESKVTEPVLLQRTIAKTPSMSTYSKVAYSAFVVVLLHIFLYIAMGVVSFKRFWQLWQIPVFASLLWGALLFAVGVPLWHIVAVMLVAVFAAPNVMHIISTYLVKQRRDKSISQWTG